MVFFELNKLFIFSIFWKNFQILETDTLESTTEAGWLYSGCHNRFGY